MCSEVEVSNFTTLIYRVLNNVGKIMLKMTESLWKNIIIIAKDVQIILYISLLRQLEFLIKNIAFTLVPVLIV
jgi:hypothetical protein